MKTSKDRILTTHVGSLARPDNVLHLLFAKERRETYSSDTFESSVRQAVLDIVEKQVGIGIDAVCDGEQSKSSFLTYIAERLTGFSPGENLGEDLWLESRETLAFPEYYDAHRKARAGLVARPVKLVCTAPVEYCGHK
ncbi:MAG TPA: methionine synthase, partial [Verrucomicrobia bacterium]|nr:methionine synthase [Verrucomicrobiota bacterium]